LDQVLAHRKASKDTSSGIRTHYSSVRAVLYNCVCFR